MSVRYDNEQDHSDSMNGTAIGTSAELAALLNNRRREAPFFARLSGDNGFELAIGIGGDVGCVQYSRSDGDPPYLMAVSRNPLMKGGYVEFLTADTPTPIAARYILTFAELKDVAIHFLESGERSDTVSWQMLDPRAIAEDVKRLQI